jgi:hypothetical protein
MKTILLASILLSAAPVAAQAQSQSAEDLTRRLNGGPPAAAQAAPQAPAQASTGRPAPAAPTSSAAASTARSTPAPTAALTAAPTAATTPVRRPSPASAPAAAPVTPRAVPPATAPAAAPATAAPQAPPAAAPAAVALNAAAVAGLPFRIELPSGVQLFEGRAAPNAKVWSVRKAGKTLAMIYAGPSSQFPIYDGEQVTAGGRVSVVVPEGTRRVAMEHLFQRPVAPTEIHVWVMSAEGADRDAAERIAQSVDPK